MSSAVPQSGRARIWAATEYESVLPVAHDVVIDRVVAEFNATMRRRVPDGIADESEDWTYREALTPWLAMRWKRDGNDLNSELFIPAGRRLHQWASARYEAVPRGDSACTLKLTIERNALAAGLLHHIVQAMVFSLWARRLRRAIRPASERQQRSLGPCLAIIITMIAVETYVIVFAHGHTHGASILLLASVIGVAGIASLRRSASALGSAIRCCLIATTVIAVCATLIRLAPDFTLIKVVGGVAVACLLGGAATALGLAALRRRAVSATVAIVSLVAAVALTPSVAGTSLGPLDVAPDTVRNLALRGYPTSAPRLVSTVAPNQSTDEPEVRSEFRGGVGKAPPVVAAPALPDIIAHRVRPTELPSGWSWCWNSAGGNDLTSPNPYLNITTTSDYALRGLDTSKFAREWSRDATYHRPGYRQTSLRPRAVFGQFSGIELSFVWTPRDAPGRAFSGATRLIVKDGNAYSATLIWPADAPPKDITQGRRVLDDLRLTDYNDVARPVEQT